MRRAALLAPNYSLVQWSLGNVLLRQNKTEEAFAEIRKAAQNDTNYANPAISTAWQIFDGNLAQIKQNLGETPQIKTALATFLLKQKKYRGAVQIFSETIGTEKIAVGKISNGGFESNETIAEIKDFEWKIGDGSQPQIGVDTAQKHGGNNSLGIVFNSSDGKDFRAVSQLVAVEAGKKYVFETFYKSDLKTSATLRWEIVNESDGKVLAATEAVAANADWTNLKVEFTAPETAEAIIVRLVRDQCKTSACPIAGKIWFDNFALQ
jgi:tetratricopeptide (TPR) repeat protein